MTIIGYRVTDNQTKQVIRAYKAEQGKAARRFADRKDNEYGAYRYIVSPIYG